jgi:hypothetical protein
MPSRAMARCAVAEWLYVDCSVVIRFIPVDTIRLSKLRGLFIVYIERLIRRLYYRCNKKDFY